MVKHTIELDIRKELGPFRLEVSFLAEGSTVALFGPSGAGKSLTLSAIAGLTRPESGEIKVAGKSFFDSKKGINLSPQKRRVGLVFQGYALFPHMTTLQNVCYAMREKRDRAARAMALLNMVRLEKQADKHPSQLSGGQMQRVALARALAAEPEILLLDEPFSALDERIKEKLLEDIIMVRSHFDIPMVYVTHNLEEVHSVADFVVILNDGRVEEHGPKEEVLNRPRTRNASRLIGIKNIFDCKVVAKESSDIVVDVNGLRLELPRQDDFSPGESAILCIKPQDVRLVINDNYKVNMLDALVVKIIPGEKKQRIFLKLIGRSLNPSKEGSDYDLIMDMDKHVCMKWKVNPGEKMRVSLRKESLFLCR